MPSQSHDVELNGESYMVIPGSYRSYPDGNLYVDSRLQRQVLTDFTTGMAGPKLNARNLPASALFGEQSLGAWPAAWPLGVNAVGPAPGQVTTALDVGVAEPKVCLRSGGNLFIAAGDKLYRWDNDATLTLRYTAPAAIVDMARIGTALYLAHGAGTNLTRWVDHTSTATTNVSSTQLRLVRSIGRRLVGNDPTDTNIVRIYYANLGSTSTNIDGPVVNATIHDDAVLLATERSIWAFRPSGDTDWDLSHWGVVSSDGLQNPDDYAWFVTFQGRLMAWQGGRAVIYDKQRGWWRHAGFEAAESYGAALVNGWLMVSARPRGVEAVQIWGYNGSGWWLMAETGAARFIAGSRGDRLIGFEPDDGNIHYWNMDAARDAASVTPDVTVDSTLIDGNAPDQPKFWTRAGVELARADPADVGEWSVQLSYSLDAGATWIPADAPAAVDQPVETVSATIGATSAYLRLRVELEQVSGLPPHILALWAEFEVINESVRRRRWQFRIAASDRTLTREGELDPRDGEEIRGDLWALFDGPASFTFRDVDASSHTVRVIGLREEWTRPADLPKIGAHSSFEVVLVEL